MHDSHGLVGQLNAVGTVPASQSRVAIRSENTTTRSVDRGPTPMSCSWSTRRWSLALESSSIWLVEGGESAKRGVLSLAVPRLGPVAWLQLSCAALMIVSRSALWDDRNALSSVHGNRLAPLAADRRRAGGGVHPGVGELGEDRFSAAVAATGIGFGGRRSAHWWPTSAATSCLVAADVEVLDVLAFVRLRVGDRGRVEQADELGEATRGRRCAAWRW